MLAIEQLDLDIEVLSLYWIDGAKLDRFEDIKSLFENYIKHIIEVELPEGISSAMTTSIACG